MTYYSGRFGSLKHNIILMLCQIQGNIKYANKSDCKQLDEDLHFIEKKVKRIRYALTKENNHSQESPRVEKLVEGKNPSQTRETTNGVAVDNTSPTHPDTHNSEGKKDV